MRSIENVTRMKKTYLVMMNGCLIVKVFPSERYSFIFKQPPRIHPRAFLDPVKSQVLRYNRDRPVIRASPTNMKNDLSQRTHDFKVNTKQNK